MNKSAFPVYPLLSILSYYLVNIITKTPFVFFGIFLYIASSIALLAYLESDGRNRKTDAASAVIYIAVLALFYALAYIAEAIKHTDISVKSENISLGWLLLYLPFVIFPVILLYINRKKKSAAYIPAVISAAAPAMIFSLILIFASGFRTELILFIDNLIQTGFIDPLTKLKENTPLPDYYADALSYLSLYKSEVAKQTAYMIPAFIFISLATIVYLTDRLKPAVSDGKLIIREFRLPDNFIWILILGGFLILAPVEELKFVSYNIIAVFGVLYFFQGLQILNKIFDKYNISIFIRSLVFFFIFIEVFLLAVVALLGLFSIWFKPKWLEKNNGEDDKNNGNGRSDDTSTDK